MRHLVVSLLAVGLAVTAAYASAEDGCRAMLCLAGNWKDVAPCRPPVEKVLRDLALGRSFPVCHFKNDNGSETDSRESGFYSDNHSPTRLNCPPMYSTYSEDTGRWMGCIFRGVISTRINAQPWADVYWDTRGHTSTHYYGQAKAQLPPDQLDPRYDKDLAEWRAAHPPGDGNGGGMQR